MDANEHVHEGACEQSQLPLADNIQPNPINHLTEAQFRQLRGRYFTIRHVPVPECGHLIDMINEPRHRNCEWCYWAWFSAHGELVQVADKALQEQGKFPAAQRLRPACDPAQTVRARCAS